MSDEFDPRLDAALARIAQERQPEDESEERLGTARARVARERGLVATLRGLSTRHRVALAGVVLAMLGAIVLGINGREDLGQYPMLRLVIEGGLSAGLSLGLAAVALTGPHRPVPSPRAAWILAGAALVLPLFLALVPPADLMLPGAKGGEHTFGRDALACFVYGLAAALPVMGILVLLQRIPPTGPRIAAIAAASAGLGGVMALQMHCPIAMQEHLLVGHATVPLAALLAALLLRRAFGATSS